MKDLLELLQLKEEFETLIENEINNLTVKEFVQLHEQEILHEGKLKDGIKLLRKIGIKTGVVKPNAREYHQILKKDIKNLDNAGIRYDPDENWLSRDGMENADYVRARLHWDKKGMRRGHAARRAFAASTTAAGLGSIYNIATKEPPKPKTRAEKIKDKLKELQDKLT